MSLPEYNKKRSFNNTPEPKGKKATRKSGALEFVIQKHAASHLHYDFRLEVKGALKSWAVPKGPSLNPGTKRLAMMVEDHPYDYKDFEGIIPEGNYGAGTVIIWDKGHYAPAGMEGETRADQEKYLSHKLHTGEVKIVMHGEKLKGEFILVRAKDKDQDNIWYLYKGKDSFASRADIALQDKSVVSGKTIEEMAARPSGEWQSNRKTTQTKSPKTNAATESMKLLKTGRKAPIPKGASPMLASLDKKPFDSPDWLYEIKWDGYRAIAILNKGDLTLTSRGGLSLKKYYPVVDALNELKMNAVLDGEIVVLGEKGRASFQLMQGWQKQEKGLLCYMVFDLLWYEGYDLTDLPLTDRKHILKTILPDNERIRYCDHVEERGIDFYQLSVDMGIEGIIAKKKDSTYAQGARTKSWLKLKNEQRMEVVVGGFTAPRNSRKYFGSLILGTYKDGKLVYIGHTGSGFDDKTVKSVYKKLEPLVTDECPFSTTPKTNMPATWVKPELVCEVKYQELTKDGILRIPIFQGLREDKTATSIREEQVYLEHLTNDKHSDMPAKKSTTSRKTAAPAAKKSQVAKKTTAKTKTLLPEDEKEVVTIITRKELKFTNLDKLYWPDEKITKRDMLNYYYAIAEYMLPYMKDRPQSLNRYPNGVKGKSFYQKDVGGKVAEWIKTYEYFSESNQENKDYLVCADEATLLYIANLGCIEMNPWHSRTKKPDNPDWSIIDLDPDDISFDKVVETARVVKEVLDGFGVESFCKTSGSTGLHIYVPFGAKYSYDQSKLFAELVATMVHQELPKFTSIERSPAKRRGMIYVDFLQNRSTQTIAAPYSLRPKFGATASAPLDWSEVKKGLSISQFNIHNMLDRVKEAGDLFKGVLGKGINLEAVLKKV